MCDQVIVTWTDIPSQHFNGRGEKEDKTLSDQPVSGSRFEKKVVVLLNTAQGSVKISSSIMTYRRSVTSRSKVWGLRPLAWLG